VPASARHSPKLPLTLQRARCAPGSPAAAQAAKAAAATCAKYPLCVARDAAMHRPGPFTWWNGTLEERAWCALHDAEVALLHLLDDRAAIDWWRCATGRIRPQVGEPPGEPGTARSASVTPCRNRRRPFSVNTARHTPPSTSGGYTTTPNPHPPPDDPGHEKTRAPRRLRGQNSAQPVLRRLGLPGDETSGQEPLVLDLC
jgi:hypothetical protein